MCLAVGFDQHLYFCIAFFFFFFLFLYLFVPLRACLFVFVVFAFPVGTNSNECPHILVAESLRKACAQLGVFPNLLFTGAQGDCTHAGLTVWPGPSMSSFLPFWIAFLLGQHRELDSWDLASRLRLLWLTPSSGSSSFYFWQFSRYRMAITQCACCSQISGTPKKKKKDSHCFILYHIELLQVGLWQGCETRTAFGDTP